MRGALSRPMALVMITTLVSWRGRPWRMLARVAKETVYVDVINGEQAAQGALYQWALGARGLDRERAEFIERWQNDVNERNDKRRAGVTLRG